MHSVTWHADIDFVFLKMNDFNGDDSCWSQSVVHYTWKITMPLLSKISRSSLNNEHWSISKKKNVLSFCIKFYKYNALVTWSGTVYMYWGYFKLVTRFLADCTRNIHFPTYFCFILNFQQNKCKSILWPITKQSQARDVICEALSYGELM